MIRRRLLVALAALAISATACQSAEGSTNSSAATTTKSELAKKIDDRTKPQRDEVGLGESFTSASGRTTVTMTVYAFTPDIGSRIGASDGRHWAAADVQGCLDAVSTENTVFSWRPWTLLDATNGRYPASSSSYESFPVPQYPFAGQEQFTPGECVRGWIVFAVPDGVEVTGVKYSIREDAATWKVP